MASTAVVVLVLLLLFLAVGLVKQYEQRVLFQLGRVIGVREAGLTVIIPAIDMVSAVPDPREREPLPNGKPLAASTP